MGNIKARRKRYDACAGLFHFIAGPIVHVRGFCCPSLSQSWTLGDCATWVLWAWNRKLRDSGDGVKKNWHLTQPCGNIIKARQCV